MNDSKITLEVRQAKDSKLTIAVMQGKKPLEVAKLDVANAKQREGLIKRFNKQYSAIETGPLREQLLELANEHTSRTSDNDTQPSEELNMSHIVRPVRFIVPEVSGLLVATSTLRNGRPTGRWILYLHWADGEREVMELADSIFLPNKVKLWFFPVPAEPNIRTMPAWTEAARKAWLAGAASPDPAGVFRRLCECIACYIDFPKDLAPETTATLALWIILSYCYPAWPAVPYLYLGGPVGSGKTRVLDVLCRLVFRPLLSSNMSAAALFRTLHSNGGTLLLDEAEQLKDTDSAVTEIKSMLLAGYRRGGRATRLEPLGDGAFKTVEFDVFGLKALACVKGLPPALLSRCISVMMFRADKNSEKPRRRLDARKAHWENLRADLHALVLDHGATFLELSQRDDICPKMSGRQFELWQPLLALASWIESYGAQGLLALMQQYATDRIELGQEDEYPDCDEILLRIMTDFVRTGQAPIPKDILGKAQELESSMFAKWSAKGVANAIRRYGITTRKTHGRRAYGHVILDDLRRIQTTYNMDLTVPELSEEDTAEAIAGNVPHVPQGPPAASQQPKTGLFMGSQGTSGTWGT